MIFFRRKGWLKKSGDDELLYLMRDLMDGWQTRKSIVENSVEPSDQVEYELRLAKAKYFYLLKEAKIRDVRMGRIK
jgi:hypothetical protein